MIAIPPTALSPETPFEYRVRPGNHAGYRVDVTSVVLESR